MKYEELAKKHSLPKLSEINRFFEIDSIDTEHMSLRAIEKRMVERIECVAKLIESILQPETELSSMYECNAFTDEDKKHLFETYKKLLLLHRKQAASMLDYDAETAAKLIKEVFEEWEKIVPDLKKTIQKMQEAWKAKTGKKLDLGYFG